MGLLQGLGRLFGGQIADQVAAQSAEPLEYPAAIALDGETLTLRFLERNDREAMLDFARKLPTHDLLFLRRDITDPSNVDQWIQDIEEGYYTTIAAVRNDAIVGYTSVATDRLGWTRHVAELRVLISHEMRGKHLGRLLTEQAFAFAKQRGVKKMMAQMTTDQEAAIKVFSRMGFQREARLRNQVMDRDGALHDLQIMSLDVDEFQAKIDVMLLSAQNEFLGI
ncbi:MAG: GNAT family N-acetyltransferase [Chloroflexi bacterium]|nr:GNAT family N-acetyltransferase [Chloroflexota bacterium]MYE46324.1 GNAT family N-acetyltransferase [Chloroflexota bacterium]